MSINKNKISVVTINYNSAKHVNRLIDSLFLIDKYIDEIIVIDNNSIDQDQILLSSKSILIKNKTNLGFAKAVNQGIKKASSEIIALINPDCYLENSTILNSISLINKHKYIGAVGGKLKLPNSNKYHFTATSKPSFFTGLFEFTNLKKLFPNNRFTNKFWIEKKQKISKPIEVESLCGAYIILRKHIKNKINLFDERYFLYMEDIDFGNKINKLNHKVIFDPTSEITHIGGQSNNSKYGIVLNYWYQSRDIYFKKHLPRYQYIIIKIVFSLEITFLKLYHHISSTPNV